MHCSAVCFVAVMEVINGDYGDVTSKLAQAVLSGECDAFNERYKVCLPNRFSSSRSSKGSSRSSKRSLLDGKRDSSSCISTRSSNASSPTSREELSLNKKSTSYPMFASATDSSSKDSSEEVSGLLLLFINI